MVVDVSHDHECGLAVLGDDGGLTQCRVEDPAGVLAQGGGAELL